MAGEDTFPKLLKRNCERWGDKKVALRFKDFGIWWPYTWKDYYEKAKLFGLGLKSLGLERGDKVSVIGDNAPEAFFAELGAQAVGGIEVGLYTDAIGLELKYLVEHSDTKFAVVDDQEQVDKFLQIRHELPQLTKIIYWDSKGLSNYDDPLLISFSRVCELGERYDKEQPGFFEKCIREGNDDDVALLLYTSGTRDLPKGAILTYRNILSALEAVMKIDSWTEDAKTFSFLPLAWIPEQVFGIGGPLLTGCSVSFPEQPETVQTDVREIGPTQLSYGARQWESLTSMMQAQISESGFFNKFVFNLLLPIGYKWADLITSDKKASIFWRFLHTLADWVLFRHIRDDMGLSHLRFAWTSAASLSPDSFRLLQAIGIPLRAHYASTEVCAICNSGKEFKMETVGRPVPGTKVKISEEGEILVRGDQVFKGYYKDPEATSKAIKDGWFHTGDAGFLDDNGHLIFLDRLADLTELGGGAKVAPQYIESRLRFSPYIKDAIAIADKEKNFVSTLVTISFENVGRWAEKNRIPYTTYIDLSQKKEVYDLIYREILRVNKVIPNISRIQKFVLLHKEFDPDESELTRTRKLRRDFIKSRYSELIAGIYSGMAEISVAAQVRYQDGRAAEVRTGVRVMNVDEGQLK